MARGATLPQSRLAIAPPIRTPPLVHGEASLAEEEGEPENVLAEPVLPLARRLGIRSGALEPVLGLEYGDFQMYRYGPVVLDPFLNQVPHGELTESFERSLPSICVP